MKKKIILIPIMFFIMISIVSAISLDVADYELLELFNRSDSSLLGCATTGQCWTKQSSVHASTGIFDEKIRIYGVGGGGGSNTAVTIPYANPDVNSTKFFLNTNISTAGNLGLIYIDYDTNRRCQISAINGDWKHMTTGASLVDMNLDYDAGVLYNLSITYNSDLDKCRYHVWNQSGSYDNMSDWFPYFTTGAPRGIWLWAGNSVNIAQVDSLLVVNGTELPEIIPDVYSNELILVNRDFTVLPTISEDDFFYVLNNFTKNGITKNDSTCNFTSYNISAHFSYKSDVNYTLIDNTYRLDLNTSEAPNTIQDDLIEFQMCRLTNKVDVNVYVNNLLHHTIDNDIIPLCSIGTHFETNITRKYINNKSVNVSIRCDGCNGGNKQIKLVIFKDELLHFERRFLEHSEDMPYNNTAKLYNYLNHQYNFIESGDNQSIILNCDNNVTEYLINVSDVNITTEVISVNDVEFTNGMYVEASEEYNFIFEFTGDILVYSEINLTYENGTFIDSTNIESLNVSNLQINQQGLYNLTSLTIDDEGVNVITKFYFYINDTTFPTITWNNPLSDNLSIFILNDIEFIDLSFYDINLFAYEVLVFDPSDNLVYNFSLSNIVTPTKNLVTGVSNNVTGTWTINATVSDDHTSNNIKDYNYETNDRDMIFTDIMNDDYHTEKNISIEYNGIYPVDDLKLEKKMDRYTFEYKFYYGTDSFLDSVRHEFRVECEDIIYRSHTDYIGHMVCPINKKWIDFDNDYLISHEVKRCGSDCYDVELVTLPVNKIKFKSIGGLNIISEIVTFEVTADAVTPPIELFNLDFTLLSTYLILGIMIMIMAMFYYFGFLIKSIIPFFISTLVGVLLGIALLPLNSILGITVACFVIVVLFATVKL